MSPDALQRPRGETPASLQKRVRELEKQLARTEDLVRVLRMAPWSSQASELAPKGGSHASKKRTAKTRARQAPKTDRSPAPKPTALEGGSGRAG